MKTVAQSFSKKLGTPIRTIVVVFFAFLKAVKTTYLRKGDPIRITNTKIISLSTLSARFRKNINTVKIFSESIYDKIWLVKISIIVVHRIN